MSSIPQEEQQVKSADYIFGDPPVEECGYDGCHEPVFRPGLCWEHFIEEQDMLWDAQQAERETCWAGMGR